MTSLRRTGIWLQRFSDLRVDERRHLTANYSIPIDKIGFGNLPASSDNERGFQTRDSIQSTYKVFRLAHKLGIPTNNMARFAADFDRFRMRPSANYDLRGRRPFSSLDDGTYWRGAPVTPTNPNGYRRADPRVAKVKRFLRIHLTREPTDKDVDLVVYTYFGSDMFPDSDYVNSIGDLDNGMQDSYYNARGRKKRRNATNNFDNEGPIRRNQRRLRSGRGYNRSTYRYHGGDWTNSNSYSNSNSNSNSNSESNSNSRHSNSGEYKANTTRVKKNQNKNEKNKRIQWSRITLNNAPRNEITFDDFANGNKAVKLSWKLNGKTHSQYVSPQTFRDMARMSMTNAFNKARNFTLFKNPFTRGTVKRSNIDFVILNLNKRKTVAATKIQKVVRGSQARTKIRRNAERAMRLASIVQRTAAKKNNKKRATARTARAERKEKLRSKRSGRQ